jgi:hypothetical protein
MTKKSLIVTSLLLIGTSAVAQNEYFIGFGIGNASATTKTLVRRSDTTSSTFSNSYSGGFSSILGGTIIDDKHKLSIGISAYNINVDITMTSIDLSYAYLINITSKSLKPFISSSYSMNSYTEKLSNPFLGSKVQGATYPLMLGLGTDYQIDKNQFITMEYDISLFTSGSGATNKDTDTIELKIDKISRWLISYNYKF